ncbi:MAG: hypothetical protein V4582_09915 [Pseudomonadota bacterium]
MRLSTIMLAILAGASPLAGAAEPIAQLQPMGFLAGSCWLGEFAGAKQTDEHCFSWIYDGKALRDVHTVRTPGHPDYVGETTYYWDAAAKRVDYLYIENSGGISRGTVQFTPGALLFPLTQYISEGANMSYRVRWTLQGPDAYEAWSETPQKDAWVTMFKLSMKRVARR